VAEIRIGVLTCSDTRSRGEAEDTAGKALIELIEARGWLVVAYHVCPDDEECIAASLMDMADREEADVVFTCGGTGLGPRDVTPEATRAVSDREVPGIAEYLRSASFKVTKRAMLSRGIAAQRGSTLIVNLPGSEKAARESFDFLADQVEHAVEMAAGGGHS
jgi:molybdenum cofactor synthesis domain-containing protein